MKNKKELGVLTKLEIQSLKIIELEEGKIKDETCFAPASYDFRLGDEYYVPKPITNEINIDKNIENATGILNCPYFNNGLNNQIKKCSDDNHVLRIKPFTSIVISTYEILNMPQNVVGRFDLRIKWALQGLVLQVGTQIEPGYHGRLFGLLHNFSKKEICIPTLSRVLTAEFSYTSQKTSPKTGFEPMVKLKDFLDKFPAIDGTLENYLEEIRNLTKEIEENKTKIDKTFSRKMTWVTGIAVALITVAFSIGVPLIVTKFTVNKSDYPFRRVYEMENREEKLNKTINLLQQNVRKLNIKLDSIVSKKRLTK